MASTRDHLFPATSIGRTQGSRLQHVPSHESLTAHPLLSSNHPPSPGSDHDKNSGPNTNQRYVPYTPRQRVTPTAATTGTTVHPPSPQHQQGDATSKLQLMNLKAAVQNFSLDTGSVGWAILEKLVAEGEQHAPEWAEIWSAVNAGKATLLLPLEQASNHEYLTPEFVKDHVVFCDGPSRKNSQIVTLSGLRGTLDDQTLTFRSSLHPSSKTFQDLLNPVTRTSTLAFLPSLPTPLLSLLSPPVTYPTFTVPSYISSIPLPPRLPSTTSSKPPLPPRPANRVVSTSTSTPTPTSRISNPFASLFGVSPASLAKPPVVSAVPPVANASPPTSLRSFDSYSTTDHVVDVSAFTIERKIMRKDVSKDMNKSLRKEVTLSLSEALLPTWIIDRVHQFTAEWYPLVKESPQPAGRKLGRRLGEKDGARYVVNWVAETPEISSERLQDFYMRLEQDLRIEDASSLGRGKGEEEGEKHGHSSDIGDEKRIQEKINSEAKIKEMMEVVERTICSLFYDRLYMQPTSDDSSHDETLSSRVAALNMLDLGLEHLDIHVENIGPELDIVVSACGEMLSQLDSCRSPGDKAAVLVAAHKIVVDGLSRLPPIRLMSEEESKAQKAKSSAIVREKERRTDAPPRDADGKLQIRTPAVQEPAVLGNVEVPMSDTTVPEPSRVDINTSQSSEARESPIPSITESEANPNSKSPPEELSSGLSSPSLQREPGTSSPVLTMSPIPTQSTPVSGDVLLPLIIFSVVKANPPHLVSNLLYTQRYRNQSVGGEESYCLINLMAVAEFLENVDLAALGLGDSDKVMSAADLTPIPLNRSPITAETPLAPADDLPGSIRERVEQANKVITGVVDSSFGMLRSLLPNTTIVTPITPPVDGVQSAAPWNAAKPGFGLLRRESGFSIRNIASALPISRTMGRTGTGEEAGQQLMTVSRPESVKSLLREDKVEDESSEVESGDNSEDDEDGGAEGDEEENVGEGGVSGPGDTRSIRSFESMLNAKGGKKTRTGTATRKSLTDRLAHMSNLAGFKGSPPSRTTSLPHGPPHRSDSPVPSPPESPTALHLAPPIQRFVECNPGDLRLSEVGELLRDYRRLVEGIRAVGGFHE